mmetsp:Transcript_21507/g.28288  ORF Transcript_21507/g.28288 Transcript_21507/m.28288 type:complete len:88 (-) Transcript_21507:547-810(-)
MIPPLYRMAAQYSPTLVHLPSSSLPPSPRRHFFLLISTALSIYHYPSYNPTSTLCDITLSPTPFPLFLIFEKERVVLPVYTHIPIQV